MARRWWFLALVPAMLYAVPALAQGGWGWGSPTAPETKEEKAFVEEANKLHTQLRLKQQELWVLEAQEKPSESALKAKRAEVDALRTKFSDLNYKNRELRWKMMDSARGAGVGPGMGRGRGMGRGAGRGAWGCPRGAVGPGRGAGMGPGRGAGWGGRGMGVCPWGAPVR